MLKSLGQIHQPFSSVLGTLDLLHNMDFWYCLIPLIVCGNHVKFLTVNANSTGPVAAVFYIQTGPEEENCSGLPAVGLGGGSSVGVVDQHRGP